VHPSLPIYSGGHGALAGDFLKEASDRGLPCVAVGLMYRQGYFRQRLDASGWQHEYWVDTDPERLPAALVRGEDGRPLTVRVPMRGTGVTAQIWRVDVGRTPLFLLDAERPENGRMERWITAQLYAGDPVTRLAQYALLGLGGVRALGRPSASSRRCFTSTRDTPRSPRSRWPWPKGARGVPAATALEAARQRTVFTTHTPVAAGNETYPAEELAHTLGPFAASLGLDPAALVRLGRSRPDDQGEPFGVTQFALRMSRTANAVSRRHGGVAREMWRDLWPERAVDDVPITHVTNGVHLPTWLGSPMQHLLDRHLRDGWPQRAADPETWSALDAVSDAELWAVREQQRAELVNFVKDRSVVDRLSERQPREGVQAAYRAFDPDVLTR
jgi:starch phosphorylase